jgi:hypothetical protein
LYKVTDNLSVAWEKQTPLRSEGMAIVLSLYLQGLRHHRVCVLVIATFDLNADRIQPELRGFGVLETPVLQKGARASKIALQNYT